MRALTKIVATLAFVGAVTVHAQAPAPEPAADPAPGPAAKTDLSVAEMQAGAIKIEAQLEEDSNYVLRLKEAARKQKDVIKLNCVNDRIIQVKAQRNIADSANQELLVALGRDSQDRHRVYATLVASGEGVRKLREEANACVGAPEMFKQESGVDVSHPYFPDDPVNDNPFDEPVNGGTEIEPPGYASPFY